MKIKNLMLFTAILVLLAYPVFAEDSGDTKLLLSRKLSQNLLVSNSKSFLSTPESLKQYLPKINDEDWNQIKSIWQSLPIDKKLEKFLVQNFSEAELEKLNEYMSSPLAENFKTKLIVFYEQTNLELRLKDQENLESVIKYLKSKNYQTRELESYQTENLDINRNFNFINQAN